VRTPSNQEFLFWIFEVHYGWKLHLELTERKEVFNGSERSISTSHVKLLR
jgi:hypothetical protein